MSKYIMFVLFGILLLSWGCDRTSKAKKSEHENGKVETYYTCSMHPKVKQKEPGKCPICHMNLTRVEVDLSEDVPERPAEMKKAMWLCRDYPDVTSEKEETCPIDGTPMVMMDMGMGAEKIVAEIKLRKAQMGHFNPEFFPVTNMKMSRHIRLLGSVLQSEEKESNIPARIAGRVEKVYVKSTGSFVKAGDPVVDIYSPRLITAGEEFLLARQSYQNNKTKEFLDMKKQSEERLRLWGIKDFQLEKWYKTKKVPKQITIYSPSTGIVRQRNATVGKYFNEGQNFFELSNLEDVWVEMDVYEQDSALVKIGQKVNLEFTALPGEIISGEIDFVNPVLDPKSRTLKIRATIQNKTGKLKPGMVANATIELSIEGEPLVVPRSAVIDTGKRKVVWTKITNKQFQAREILAGYESQGYIEVKKGLMKGEEVVTEGNFLLDAQAQLFGGYEDMGAGGGHRH